MNSPYRTYQNNCLAFQVTEIPDSLLAGLWSFVNRDFYLKNFEQWLYANYDQLKKCLTEKWFDELLFFDYQGRKGNENDHKLNVLQDRLYQAIRPYPSRCPCIKLPHNFVTDWSQNSQHDYGEYPETWDLIITNLTTNSKYISLSTINLSALDGRILQCCTCNAYWLEVYDSDTATHYHLCLSQSQVDQASKSEWIPEYAITTWFRQTKH